MGGDRMNEMGWEGTEQAGKGWDETKLLMI